MNILGNWENFRGIMEAEKELPPFGSGLAIGRFWTPDGSIVATIGKTATDVFLEKYNKN